MLMIFCYVTRRVLCSCLLLKFFFPVVIRLILLVQAQIQHFHMLYSSSPLCTLFNSTIMILPAVLGFWCLNKLASELIVDDEKKTITVFKMAAVFWSLLKRKPSLRRKSKYKYRRKVQSYTFWLTNSISTRFFFISNVGFWSVLKLLIYIRKTSSGVA